MHAAARCTGPPPRVHACRKRVRSWAASQSALAGRAPAAAAPQQAPALPPADDLDDPLLSLCSNAQVLAGELRLRDRLDDAIMRARAMRSVQSRAFSLAQRLDLL